MLLFIYIIIEKIIFEKLSFLKESCYININDNNGCVKSIFYMFLVFYMFFKVRGVCLFFSLK